MYAQSLLSSMNVQYFLGLLLHVNYVFFPSNFFYFGSFESAIPVTNFWLMALLFLSRWCWVCGSPCCCRWAHGGLSIAQLHSKLDQSLCPIPLNSFWSNSSPLNVSLIFAKWIFCCLWVSTTRNVLQLQVFSLVPKKKKSPDQKNKNKKCFLFYFFF